MSAMDRDGNMVSLIQSNFGGFGSGVVAPGTGFALQNRGGLFSLERGHPNALAPRKRPLHTIIPAFMQKGDTRIAFGIMGGWNQSQAHAQFVSNVVDFGMNIQGALEAARFTKGTFDGCDLSMETRISPAVMKELESMGHAIKPAASPDGLSLSVSLPVSRTDTIPVTDELASLKGSPFIVRFSHARRTITLDQFGASLPTATLAGVVAFFRRRRRGPSSTIPRHNRGEPEDQLRAPLEQLWSLRNQRAGWAWPRWGGGSWSAKRRSCRGL